MDRRGVWHKVRIHFPFVDLQCLIRATDYDKAEICVLNLARIRGQVFLRLQALCWQALLRWQAPEPARRCCWQGLRQGLCPDIRTVRKIADDFFEGTFTYES